ncbi:MAG TPA: hypothetical protein PLT45_00875 [Smithella sp.]|nr:hypothetical protein [Smithella sp.]
MKKKPEASSKKFRPRWGKPVITRIKKTDASPPAGSSGAAVTGVSKKKFRPRWGKPVVTGVQKTDASPPADSSGAAATGVSKKMFRPRWGKPVIVSSPKADQSVLATSPAQTSAADPSLVLQKPEEIKHFIADASDVVMTGRQTPPSGDTAPEFSELQPQAAAKENGKNIRMWAAAAVVCLCVAVGYWYYQARSTEETITAAKAPTNAATVDKLQNSRSNEEDKVVSEGEIRDLLMKWLNSWQAADIDAYRGFYAPDFRAKGMDLGAWISHKTVIFRKSKNIVINMENLRISVDGNNATAEFTQHYSSSLSRSSDKKTLKLRRIGKEWKIYSEIS